MVYPIAKIRVLIDACRHRRRLIHTFVVTPLSHLKVFDKSQIPARVVIQHLGVLDRLIEVLNVSVIVLTASENRIVIVVRIWLFKV